MKFELYLVERSLITLENFVAALDKQQGSRVPIGKLALSEGLLQVRDLYTILDDQAKSRQRFGEIAIRLGFLTLEQVDHLLVLQQTQMPSVADLLLGLGILDAPALEKARDDYRALLSCAPNSAPAQASPTLAE
jgi:hypothetical protein